MNKPLISVVVPVYNVEKYLGCCIESIVGQTYKNLQIILVDDGSTDSSYQICMDYAKKDARIAVFQKENGGLASARNEGLRHINGEYVTFVDSDDRIEPDTYDAMYNAAQSNPDCIVTCGRYNVDEQTGRKEPVFKLESEQVWSRKEAIRRFLTWDCIDTSVCDKLFPAKLIENLEFLGGLVSEDVLFTYPSLERAEGVVHIGKCKYNYLQRSGSISHSGYSPRSKGLTVYPKAVWERVNKNFPELKKEADYYRFSRSMIYVKLLYSNGRKEKEEAKAIRKKLFSILNNGYFSAKEKIVALCIAANLYGILSKALRKLKKHRS